MTASRDTLREGMARAALRDLLVAACFDPGSVVGSRGGRETDEWRADACMARLAPILDRADSANRTMEKIIAAEAFARRAHAGQTDKGGAPYAGHLGRVAARARAHAERLGLPRQHAEWCQQVGWLHDTIEDTGTSADDLLDVGFDPAVVQAVQLLTRIAGKPYFECVARIIGSGNRIAMIVKLADNEDNLDPSRMLPGSLTLRERYETSATILRCALNQAWSAPLNHPNEGDRNG